jgi:hypothetical protein
MKIENNRALAAEKKNYEIPSVSMIQLKSCGIICVSPSGGITVNPTPIDNEGGD